MLLWHATMTNSIRKCAGFVRKSESDKRTLFAVSANRIKHVALCCGACVADQRLSFVQVGILLSGTASRESCDVSAICLRRDNARASREQARRSLRKRFGSSRPGSSMEWRPLELTRGIAVALARSIPRPCWLFNSCPPVARWSCCDRMLVPSQKCCRRPRPT